MLAGVETGIGIGTVPVIAGFNAFMLKTVAAKRQLTGVETAIGIGAVSVITGLPRLFESVSAGGKGACIGALVIVNIISVIAAFNPDLEHPVSTGPKGAVREAEIAIIGVGVIAFFDSLLDKSVPAGGIQARI